MSRDSQLFRVSPNISGMDKATNVELVNKTGNVKYVVSLIKQQILNTKLISLQNCVRATESHIFYFILYFILFYIVFYLALYLYLCLCFWRIKVLISKNSKKSFFQ